MRSNISDLEHTTTSLSSLSLAANPANSKKQQNYLRSITPNPTDRSTLQSSQMTTGSGISSTSTSPPSTQHKPTTLTISTCNSVDPNSSNTLGKSATITSTLRHNNGNLSTNNISNLMIGNNNNGITNKDTNSNNSNGNDSNIQNANWNKLQTLEQRKLELEKLLNEKNWLLQQIHNQEAQILNGNYESFNLNDAGRTSKNLININATTDLGSTNSLLRRKGSSSLKLTKNTAALNEKNNRFTLSKSEYDLAKENKPNNQATHFNINVLGVSKRQGLPQKTNSFHDTTASALSLTKSPSFEYNRGTSQTLPTNSNNISKYNNVRSLDENNENVNCLGAITQCDKYYLSPTNQLYTDNTGFIKAGQDIKQCVSSPHGLHTGIVLNDTDTHNTKQHTLSSQNLIHNDDTQSHLDQCDRGDVISLTPSSGCSLEQTKLNVGQHPILWRNLPETDRTTWCDATSYIELDSDGIGPYHSMKSIPRKVSGQSLNSYEPSLLNNFYTVNNSVVGSHPGSLAKACDEISISSVNSEANKKPKMKQWMESSLDGPIIRPNIPQTTPIVPDTYTFCPPLSPTFSQNPQYTYYAVTRPPTPPNISTVSGKMTPSPSAIGNVNSMLVAPLMACRPSARTLPHHSHTQHKQPYRERSKLSSQSMCCASYKAQKANSEEDSSHLSHSKSLLNVDSYNHHHFHMQPLQHQLQSQPFHHSHYHMEHPNKGSFTLSHGVQQQQQQQQPQQQQHYHHQQHKLSKAISSQQPCLLKLNSTLPLECTSSTIANVDDSGLRYATPLTTQSSRIRNPSQTLTKAQIVSIQKPLSSIPFPDATTIPQLSPQSTIITGSPDIRIESPKNMTVVQQATFLPYKEVTKPFEMSDFYKYSTKFRQKEANTTTLSKNTTT